MICWRIDWEAWEKEKVVAVGKKVLARAYESCRYWDGEDHGENRTGEISGSSILNMLS